MPPAWARPVRQVTWWHARWRAHKFEFDVRWQWLNRSLYPTLGRFPITPGSAQFYLLCQPQLREDAFAEYLFGQDSPYTWFTRFTPAHDIPQRV